MTEQMQQEPTLREHVERRWWQTPDMKAHPARFIAFLIVYGAMCWMIGYLGGELFGASG